MSAQATESAENDAAQMRNDVNPSPGTRVAAISCQGPRKHMYLLPISGILRLEPDVDEDPDVMLVHMSRATAPVRVVGTLAEFLSLLPTDHVAARPHVSVKVENDSRLHLSGRSSGARRNVR